MTRMCLARFEKDDTEEARVVCRTGAGTGVCSEDNPGSHNMGPERPPGSTEGGADDSQDHRSKIWTLHLPEWINFNYSTVPRRLRPPHQRQPNPFGPRARTFSRLESVDENKSTASSQEQRAETRPLRSPFPEKSCQPPVSTSLVKRHPPLASWDDEPRHDTPYDNPYYTKPISNVLWLPRNPLGLLDLNDTVDVSQALTSDPGAGDVGHWFGPGSSAAPESQLPGSVPSEGRPPIPAGRQYSGREDIDLPEGIKSRISPTDQERDMSSTRARRPSIFSRHRSGSGVSMTSSGIYSSRGRLRRSLTEDPEFPRISSSDRDMRPTRDRAISDLPPPNLHLPSQFHGVDPGSRPDLHAQTEFVRSTASIVHSASGSRVSLPHPTPVTPREAIITEAIAEEQLAAAERLKREQAEARPNHGSTPRPWLTSWIYAKVR